LQENDKLQIKISIVTVCFNSEDTIRDTIESVLSQDYEHIEYIIVDGGSNDDTLKILEKNRQSIDRLIVEDDDGIYDAMNKGIQVATGDFIGILNSDDIFADTTTISSVARLLTKRTEVDGIYGDLIYVKRNDLSVSTRFYSSVGFRKWKLRYGMTLPHPTLYLKKELFEQHGYYKLNYRVAADFEFIARLMVNGVLLIRNPEVMVYMREGGVSSNGLFWRVHQNFEIVRACRENNIYSNILFLSLKLPIKLLSYINYRKIK